jgi:hypothetical protein
MNPNEIADKVIKRIENTKKIYDLMSGWLIDSELTITVRQGLMQISINYINIASFGSSRSGLDSEIFREEKIAYDRIRDAISKRKALDKQNALDKL